MCYLSAGCPLEQISQHRRQERTGEGGIWWGGGKTVWGVGRSGELVEGVDLAALYILDSNLHSCRFSTIFLSLDLHQLKASISPKRPIMRKEA